MRDEARVNRGEADRGSLAKARALAGLAEHTSLTAFLALLAVLALCGALTFAGREVSRAWIRMGSYGRLNAAGNLMWPAAILAHRAGLIHGHLVSLTAGGAGWLAFWAAGKVLRARGRRRWRRGQVQETVPAQARGWREAVALNTSVIAADRARIAGLEEDLGALRRGLSAMCAAAGIGEDAPAPATAPHLRLVPPASLWQRGWRGAHPHTQQHRACR